MPVGTPRFSATYPVGTHALPPENVTSSRYEVRFARDRGDLEAVLRLRFEVFNLELNEGLAESHVTGLDEDDLDARFHHLMIVERASGDVVGTYRMQTAEMAASLGGFYSASEFDLTTMPTDVQAQSVEIGRACVTRPHRNGRVLHLLWRGLASYLSWNRKTVLFGCCSLTSQDPALGVATYRHLARQGHLHPSITVAPLAECECRVPDAAPVPAPHVPALFASYLSLGARACGPAAIDRHFRTIDFLVLLDVRELRLPHFRSYFP
jgi:putative hemolysin